MLFGQLEKSRADIPHDMSCYAQSLLFQSPSIEVKSLLCCSPADRVGYEHEYQATRISLVRSGVFARVIRGTPLVADATQVLFVNRGDVHRIFHPLDGGDSCTILEPSGATLKETLWHFDETATRFPVEQADLPPRILHVHYALLQLLDRRSPGDAMAAEELSLDLWTALVRHAYRRRSLPPLGRTRTAARQRRTVELVRLTLNARLQCPPSLTELARAVRCSPFHLARVFKAHVGMPVRAYVTRLRAIEAARRILDGADDFASLAFELGYYDHSHLTNAFGVVWGMPPSEFRNRRRADALNHPWAITSKRSPRLAQ
jgi:AraC family transcriptional regulator